MSGIDMYSMTDREFEENASVVFVRTIEFLYREEALTEEQVRLYLNNYAVVVRKPGFFRRIFKKEDEKPCYIIVKQCSLKEDGDD